MLTALELREFAIVDALRLEFHPGLTALTGETGAGKSILVDALTLLAGGRADAGLVRSGAEAALVQATFDGDAPHVAARRLATEGRHQARLDGEVVTVGELSEHVGRRLAVFAQHGAQGLLSGPAQREALDRLLDEEAAAALAEHRDAWGRLRALQEEADRLRGDARERARRSEMLRWQIEEIDAAEVRPGERGELEAEAARLRHAEQLREAASAGLGALDDEEGAVSRLAAGWRALSRAHGHDPQLDALAQDLSETLAGAQAVQAELQGFLDAFDADPEGLERLEGRLARLSELERKYGEDEAAVLAHREACAAELDSLEGADDRLEALGQEMDAQRERLAAHAATVSAARRRAAEALEAEVVPHLRALALPEARFEVALDADDGGPHGRERVRFLFGANAGEPLAPLSQVASGGELSRVMLALNLVTGSARGTLVFDEVDAGVGGRAARAVGELLGALARRHQVLVVTHQAQVAAFADTQVHVSKATEGGRTVARAEVLDDTARERELARMLSGTDTEAARRNARELLREAGGQPAGGA